MHYSIDRFQICRTRSSKFKPLPSKKSYYVEMYLNRKIYAFMMVPPCEKNAAETSCICDRKLGKSLLDYYKQDRFISEKWFI